MDAFFILSVEHQNAIAASNFDEINQSFRSIILQRIKSMLISQDDTSLDEVRSTINNYVLLLRSVSDEQIAQHIFEEFVKLNTSQQTAVAASNFAKINPSIRPIILKTVSEYNISSEIIVSTINNCVPLLNLRYLIQLDAHRIFEEFVKLNPEQQKAISASRISELWSKNIIPGILKKIGNMAISPEIIVSTIDTCVPLLQEVSNEQDAQTIFEECVQLNEEQKKAVEKSKIAEIRTPLFPVILQTIRNLSPEIIVSTIDACVPILSSLFFKQDAKPIFEKCAQLNEEQKKAVAASQLAKTSSSIIPGILQTIREQNLSPEIMVSTIDNCIPLLNLTYRMPLDALRIFEEFVKLNPEQQKAISASRISELWSKNIIPGILKKIGNMAISPEIIVSTIDNCVPLLQRAVSDVQLAQRIFEEFVQLSPEQQKAVAASQLAATSSSIIPGILKTIGNMTISPEIIVSTIDNCVPLLQRSASDVQLAQRIFEEFVQLNSVQQALAKSKTFAIRTSFFPIILQTIRNLSPEIIVSTINTCVPLLSIISNEEEAKCILNILAKLNPEQQEVLQNKIPKITRAFRPVILNIIRDMSPEIIVSTIDTCAPLFKLYYYTEQQIRAILEEFVKLDSNKQKALAIPDIARINANILPIFLQTIREKNVPSETIASNIHTWINTLSRQESTEQQAKSTLEGLLIDLNGIVRR